jgi:aspartyl-tRNA(Asn)/glutamyl-tRNA(Gln) amidotransferase subunit C
MKLEDVKKLADLARIDMSEEEMTTIAKDFDPILAYVGQVQEAIKSNKNISEGKELEDHTLYNVMREDIPTNNRGEYTKEILADAPDTQDGFLKVKQIL